MAKRQLIPRTRNAGTWTEAQFMGRLRSMLRKLSMWWVPKKQAHDAARVRRGRYRCARCGGVFGPKGIQVDHVEPCGSLRCLEDLPAFVARLLPEDPGAFEVLCKPCHKAKTDTENAARREARRVEKLHKCQTCQHAGSQPKPCAAGVPPERIKRQTSGVAYVAACSEYLACEP